MFLKSLSRSRFATLSHLLNLSFICFMSYSSASYSLNYGIEGDEEYEDDIEMPVPVDVTSSRSGGLMVSDENIKYVVYREIRRLGWSADLNHINVSQVTDLSDLFMGSHRFNGDISKWDVSRVKNINRLFMDSGFAGDISNWDLESLESAQDVFTQNLLISIHPDLLSKWYSNVATPRARTTIGSLMAFYNRFEASSSQNESYPIIPRHDYNPSDYENDLLNQTNQSFHPKLPRDNHNCIQSSISADGLKSSCYQTKLP